MISTFSTDILGIERVSDSLYCVKTLDDGRHIDVVAMLYNWRLVRSDPERTGYDRGFCYFGHGHGGSMRRAFMVAVLAGLQWDGADDTEPAAYDKRAV